MVRCVNALERLRAETGETPLAFRAPGRANLIGEHTDYNDGWVLPVALELDTWVVGTGASGGALHLRSLDQPGEVTVDLATGDGPTEGWGRYATAVVRALGDAGADVRGFVGLLASDVPIGAGLSSSAALEVAVASAVAARPLPPVELALACQRAENVHVGVRTGIMDQLASAACSAGHALLIDCRELTTEAVALPGDLRVLLVDSATPRELTSSAYNERRTSCEQAAAALGVPALRDADMAMLEAARDRLDPVAFRRARHVIGENQRVHDAVAALREGRTEALAALFAASHRSLAGDYEVSTPALDLLVELAVATPGVLAARLTGAGFGGCTVNLVEAHAAEAAAASIAERYRHETGRDTRTWVSRAAAAAGPG
jgi:galactokinase